MATVAITVDIKLADGTQLCTMVIGFSSCLQVACEQPYDAETTLKDPTPVNFLLPSSDDHDDRRVPSMQKVPSLSDLSEESLGEYLSSFGKNVF